MPCYSFTCQTSSLAAMAHDGFDFNTCIYDGNLFFFIGLLNRILCYKHAIVYDQLMGMISSCFFLVFIAVGRHIISI